MIKEADIIERPSSITLISLWEIFTGLTGFYYIFKGVPSNSVDILHFAIGSMFAFACGIGFWLMKKWAVYLYVVFGFINQVVLLLLGRWNFFSLLVLVIVGYVGYRHLSRMS